ncbi:hypothetical protein T484DRAFT_1813250 [Baffinella frigidus]|nr:hypothetical protein T484DRAFT_1813250 [Cryptophyta sp. CCMP2293]
MSDEARYAMLAKSVSEMRELCSKRPDLQSEKQLVDRFDDVMRNIRSQEYEHICESPVLSDPVNLASGWLSQEEPLEKPLRPAVIARCSSSADKRESSKDIVLSAGSSAPAVRMRPARSCSPAPRSFSDPLDVARYDMLAKSVSDMRELCSKRPDLQSEKQLVDRFDDVLRNIRSQEYEDVCESPVLSDPVNLASGWLSQEEPLQKPLRPAVIARSPSSADKRESSKDIVLSAGSSAPAVRMRPARSCSPAPRSFSEPLQLRPTRFGDESWAAPALSGRISWDSNEYLWEFPVAASRKCREPPVLAPTKPPIRVKLPLWECQVAQEV